MSKIRNEKLYEFIMKHYVKAKKPMTVEQIALCNDMSLGGVKNFMYRHELSRKKRANNGKQRI